MDARLARKVGSAARAARTRMGLTQAEVAELLPMATEVYGRMERGVILPSVETLRKLCITLAMPADELLGLGELDPSEVEVRRPLDPMERPEVRRLIRRLARLDRRKLWLLTLLVSALSR